MLRWIGWGVLGLILVAGIAAGSLWAYLHSSAGERRLKETVVETVNGAIAGRLEVSGLSLDGAGDLVLTGATLYDPDGGLVARVGRLEAHAGLLRLVTKHILLEKVVVSEGALLLVEGPAGLNLVRAVAARGPAGTGGGAAFTWDVEVQALDASDLHAEYRAAPGVAPAADLRAVRLQGSGRYRAGESRVALTLSGDLAAPFAGPLSLEVAAHGGSPASPHDPLSIDRLALRADASRVKLTGLYEHGGLSATLQELVVARRDLAALAPDAPLASDLSVTGEATVDAAHATAVVRLARSSARAAVTFSPLTVEGALSLVALDLSTLITGAPKTRLAGTASGRYEPARGAATLKVELAPSILRKVAVERLTGTGSLSEGKWTTELALAIPGGDAHASGSFVVGRALDLSVRVAIADLGTLGPAVAALADASDPPQLGGKGALTGRITGSFEVPVLQVTGALPALTVGPISFEALALEGKLPNVRRPSEFQATVRAESANLADTLRLRPLDASLQADGRRFSASAKATGVSTRIAGELDQDLGGARVDSLTLLAEALEWKLARPARLDLRDGARVDHLALRAGDQAVLAQGGLTGSRLDLQVEVQHLDLAQVPSSLAPTKWGLAGRVSGSGHLGGTTSLPLATATLTATGVAGFGLDAVGVSASGALTGDRLTGKATVTREKATAVARVDLPRALLRAAPALPVSASLDLSGASLGDLAKFLELPSLRQGQGGLQARLSGTVAHPRLEATARLEDAIWDGYPAANLVLGVEVQEGTAVKADLAAAGTTAHLEAQATTSLRGWTAPPTLAQLQALPFTARLQAPALDLATLPRALLPTGLVGTATLDATFDGSVQRPRGEVVLGLAGATLGPLEAVAGTATLTAGDLAIDLLARASIPSGPLGQLTARLGAPLESLRSLASISAATVAAELESSPIDLATLTGPDALGGSLHGDATLSGTLAAPVLAWKLSVDDLRAVAQPLAQGQASGTYRGGVTTATLHLAALQGGSVEAGATLHADLSLPALVAGVPWSASPFEARLDAEDLNLGGLAVSDSLRSLAGVLTAQVSASGTLAVPVPRGSVSLRGGAFTLGGFGSYREVSLDLSVDDTALELRSLTAKAAGGSLSLTASGARAAPSDPYRLAGKLVLVDFPLVIDDQLVAHLSAETESITVEGRSRGSGSLVIALAHLQVTLPDGSSKSLQSLEPDPDIVIVDGTAPRKEAPGKSGSGGLQLTLKASAPGNLWVQSADGRVEASADIQLVVGSGRAVLRGEVKTLGGTVEVLGRRFDVSSGTLRWTGGPPDNPRLDLHAVHENATEGVLVRVRITGSARAPVVELSSEPPLDQQQIAALLATGRRDPSRGSAEGASGGAASVLTGLVASKVRRVVATRLPLDVLRVEVGDKGPSSTELEAGTHLTDRIYVGYQRKFGAESERGENGNEVRLKYQLSPSITLESSYGDAGRGGANVVYTRDY